MTRTPNTEQEPTNALLNAVSSLIVAIELDDKIVRFNRACEKITGYTFEDVQRTAVQEMFASHDEIRYGGKYL